jgi:hypothetical protein
MPSASSTLLSRLQHSGGQVVVLHAPPEFKPVMDKWRSDGLPVSQRRTPGSRFVLAFVHSCADIERQAGAIVTSVGRDGILWFAYPKKSSQRYRSDIARDDSWAVLGRMGYEGVRQVAIDDDWTALRFRHVDAIRSLTRDPSRAISEAGRARTSARP